MSKFSAARSSVALLALALALAGCGGGGGSSAVPPTGGSPSIATPAAKGQVEFTILIPKSTSNAKRPAYVSPATQSMTVNITGTGGTANPAGFPQTVGLTPTSQGCTSTLASTSCTLQLALAPGTYAASISTYDGANGTGNALSTAQAVAFTVVANQNNDVPLTLSGIPKSIAPTYLGGGNFLVAALDAGNNYIVGGGAPTFTVAKSGGATAVTITQPTTAAPNAFQLAGAALGSETLTITAGYPAGETSGCTQPGAVCTTSFSANYLQELFVSNYSAGNVLGFSVPFATASQAPNYTFSGGGNSPYAIALDGAGNLFFVGYGTGLPVSEVATPYTGSPVTLTGTTSNSAYGLALDASGDLFVANAGSSTVVEYAAPYTGSAIATVSTGVNSPYWITLDTSGDLFVANFGAAPGTATEYAPPYASLTATLLTNNGPAGVTLDASGNLWVANNTANSVQEFSPPFSTTTPVATITTGVNGPSVPPVFDASGNLFVSNYGNSTITEYSPPFSNGSAPVATFTSAGSSNQLVFDKAGNLYCINQTGGSGSGSITEFAPPFSNASVPVYTVTTGFNSPYLGALTKTASLTVTIP